MRKKALIIGAGITGPATAMGLQKAGIDSTVYEAYDRTADGVGAFLTLAVNGLAALRELDIDPVLPGGFDTPRMRIASHTGRRLAEFANGPALPPTGKPGQDDRRVVSQTIRRFDLYVYLRDEAVRRGIDIEYGKRLEDAQTTPQGTVVARFTDGTEAEADLLIGADGLQSRTRQIIDPTCPPPRFTGLLNTGGYAAGIDVPGEPGMFHMIFGKRAFFAYLIDPSGEVWWYANVPRARQATRAELAAYTPESWRAELEALFQEDNSPAVDILRHSAEVVLPWNTRDLPTVPVWHKGHLLVIGDAAHAMSPSSGQGASMALEDAVVLSRCLRDIPEIPAAIRAYELQRRDRVEQMIAQGKRNSDHKVAGVVGRIVRDHVIMPLVARLAARSGGDPTGLLRGYTIDWDEPAKAAAPA